MSDVYSLSVNPFEEDAVEEPRSVTFSVEGLNDKPLMRLQQKFERLKEGQLPRSPIAASQAQLVEAPEPGYGKSHLLGRLFLKLGEEATQIYLRPFQDYERAWHSILLTTVQELGRPSQHGNYGATQLEAFAMGFIPAGRSTSCDRSRVRRRRWTVIPASGAGSCADSPAAPPSPSSV
jgi:hypothetical protein